MRRSPRTAKQKWATTVTLGCIAYTIGGIALIGVLATLIHAAQTEFTVSTTATMIGGLIVMTLSALGGFIWMDDARDLYREAH